MHPYPEELLPATMSALGKAFDFADKHLPEGLASFYELFACSDVARTFDGPDAHPDLTARESSSCSRSARESRRRAWTSC